MIKFIKLKDFQSHKDTTLNLHPLFNIIVGSSGHGKSAIIRAIKCLAFNHPGVSEVRLPDAKTYHVEIGINDSVIKRDKGTGVNSYTIDDNQPLIDVNKDVPPSVVNALNIRTLELDASCDVNIQFASQLEGPFMLSEKDSVKMKFLNTLSGTNAVDLAAKRAVAVAKENSRIAKTASEELKKLKETEKQLENALLDVSSKVKFLKKAQETLAELENMRKPFQDLYDMSVYLDSEYKKLKILDTAFTKINVQDLEDKIAKLNALLTLKKDASSLKNKYTVVNKSVSAFANVDTTSLSTKIETLEKLITIRTLRDSLKEVYFKFTSKVKELNAGYTSAVETYIGELHKQKACPVCGNTITDACIDKLVNSL